MSVPNDAVRRRSAWGTFLKLVACILTPGMTFAVEQLPDPASRPVQYQEDIRPIFETHCYKCHGPDRQKSGFRLDVKAEALAGGERGVDIVPGQSAASPLVRFVAGLDEDMQMPPAKGGTAPLTTEQIGLIRAWIDQGAVWPEGTGSAPAAVTVAAAAKTAHWSFQPAPRPPLPPPDPSGWARNELDLFILDRLKQEKLSPSPEADRRTLIRRVSFDLTGLPPTPSEVESFVADGSVHAYEDLVERLLRSPRYGERWARYWLDTVHFGETHGYDKDKVRPNAWPYRDYVIRSLNRDKAYSRFVEEQLAGDILFPDDPDGVMALGFLAAGPWDFVGHAELPESKTDGLIARYNDRDDMVMTTMATFQSLTVHCARCHDHKFDPITQEDYYGLQAVFAGVDRADRWVDSDPAVFHKRKKLLEEKSDLEKQLAALSPRVEQVSPAILKLVEARRAELKKQMAALPAKGVKENLGPAATGSQEQSKRRSELESDLRELELERTRLLEKLLDERTRTEVAQLEDGLGKVDQALAELPAPGTVYAATHEFQPTGSFKPAPHPREVQVLRRGDVKQPIHAAEPGALTCFTWLREGFQLSGAQDEGSRRAALARWITQPANLLTRRSIVNRVWQYHFGRGIVETPNDFGHMGALPTHPELLDWLSYWFLDHGESLKELHRLILLSATYRQSSESHPEGAKVDGDNRYLWRMNRSRLDAEALRDAVLSTAGQLDLTMGGPSDQQFFFKDDHSPVYDYARFDVNSPLARRRSIYRFIVRSVPDPLMETLDCPDPSLLSPRRGTTITALQALALLNDPLVLRQAEHLAERIGRAEADPARQIEGLFQATLSRPPSAQEEERLVTYLQDHGLTNLCRLVFNLSEFMFVD